MVSISQLYERAIAQGIEIDEMHTEELKASAYPQGWILIDPSKYDNDRAFKCNLAHEIAHCETGSFYNVHSRFDLRAKCEYKANKRAAQILMPFNEVAQALRDGVDTTWELAEVFEVTEEFAAMAVRMYEDKLQQTIGMEDAR